MKYKYRIIQKGEDYFQVQYRPWWLPFWQDQNAHGTLQSAQNCVDYLRNKEIEYPRRIKY